MRKQVLYVVGAVGLTLTSFASPAFAAGKGQGSGGGGEVTTEIGNNLSVPAEFVPSSTAQGAPALNVPCTSSPQAPQGAAAGGYWEAAADGGVFTFGNAGFYGSLGGIKLAKPVVGITATATGHGYWLVASDGGVFAFGDAGFSGSTGNVKLSAPVVGMAEDPATGGYWLVGSDGGVFSFNAPFSGSTGNVKLSAPVVGMAEDPATGGYWLVGSDGGVFSFNAPFFGSLGGVPLNAPIVGITSTPSGNGYRLVAADGGVFAFGDAGFSGSMGGTALTSPVVGMADTRTGQGYEMVASDGAVFTFGDSTFYGSMSGVALNKPIVGMANYPGYWLQGSTATWSAYCADAASADVTAQWGSNLKDSSALHAGSPIRVEVSLLDMAANGDPYEGYTVTNLTPDLEDRYATYGTDGTSFLSDGVNLAGQTRVWTPGTTLTIKGSNGTQLVDTPMSAEINSSGAVVYGFNWGGGNTGTTTPAGTWTLTFTIASSSGVQITGVVPGSVSQPTYTTYTTSVTVTVS